MDQAERKHRPGSMWEPVLWVAVLITVLVLGFAGFYDVQAIKGKSEPVHAVFDSLFQTLQLLLLNAGMVDIPTPWTLQVARFLAVFFTFSLFGRAFTLLRPETGQRFRASRCRDHVIIAGLGWKGQLFVQAYRRDPHFRHKIVVIEKDENNPYVRELYAQRVIVLIGDASNEKTLRDAGIHHASAILCLSDDLTNLEVANRAEQMVAHGRAAGSPPLHCHVHVGNPIIARELRDPEVTSPVPARVSRCVFNLYEIGAALCLESSDYSPLLARHKGQAPHILLLGMGDMGETLIRELLNRWRGIRAWNPGETAKVKITVVDARADHKIASLRKRIPDLEELCHLTSHPAGTQCELYDCCQFLFDDKQQVYASTAFLCSDMYRPEEEANALAIALRMQRRLRESQQKMAIVLQIIGNKSIETMFAAEQNRFRDIHTFSLFSATCLPEFLDWVTECTARTIHAHYLERRKQEGMPMYSRPAMRLWHELSPELRASNRDQARNMAAILALPGRRPYRIVRVSKAIPNISPFHQDDLPDIARGEHERYRRFKVASNPETLRKSWEELPQSERDFTITEIRAWPKILASIGFEIVPPDEMAPKNGANGAGQCDVKP